MAAQEPLVPQVRPIAERRPRLVPILGGRHGRREEDRPLIVHVVATRPDAVRLAPVHDAVAERDVFHQVVAHTGQYTDPALSSDFLREVGLPAPDHVLRAGHGSAATQIACALAEGEALLAELQPTAIVVAGAANATLGVVLAASKLGVSVARLEAGLRARDRSAGEEELNRALLDTMASVLFAPSATATENLLAEGVPAERVRHVGSTAVDGLRRVRHQAAERALWTRFGVERHRYALVTLSHSENIDDDERLARIVEALAALAPRVPVIFPLDPRTRDRLIPMGDAHRLIGAGVHVTPPLGYVDFLSLQIGAGAVVTDSGTVQEETSALGVPCFTLRAATEREITVTHGTNVLLGHDPRDLADVRPAAGPPTPCAIPLWDGRAAARIADVLVANYALVRAVGS